MNEPESHHDIAKSLTNAPRDFFICAGVALLSIVWLQSTPLYLLASVVLGGVFFMLQVHPWRTGNTMPASIGNAVIPIAHIGLRASLVPQSLFTIVQGGLVTVCTVFLLIWLLRRWVAKVCQLPGNRFA